MPNPNPVPITRENALKGSRQSALSRKAAIRLEKQLMKVGIQKEWMQDIFGVIKVAMSHPIGGAVIAYLVMAWIYDKQYGIAPFKNNPADGDHVKGAIEAYIVAAGATGMLQGGLAAAATLAK